MNLNVNAHNSENLDNVIKLKALEASAPKARSGGVGLLISIAVAMLTGGLFGCAGHIYLGRGGRGAGLYYGSFFAGWIGLVAGVGAASATGAAAALAGMACFGCVAGSLVLSIWWIVDHFKVAQDQADQAAAFWRKIQDS